MNTFSDPLNRQHTQAILQFMAYCFTHMRNCRAEQSLKLSEGWEVRKKVNSVLTYQKTDIKSNVKLSYITKSVDLGK